MFDLSGRGIYRRERNFVYSANPNRQEECSGRSQYGSVYGPGKVNYRARGHSSIGSEADGRFIAPHGRSPFP